MSSFKRHRFVETSEEDAWAVFPTPGFVVKFRDAKFINSSQKIINATKFFINVAHCTELPAPLQDLDENEVSKIIDKDYHGFKIPISISDLDLIEDKKGEQVTKVDVLINSDFFNKRLRDSEFLRQLTILIICNAIEEKHGVRLDTAKQTVLKNKKFVGELNAQQIKKKPKIDELVVSSNSVMKIDELPRSNGAFNKKLRNFKVQIIGGTFVDIRIRVRDLQGNFVHNADRISLKLNDDFCVVILDHVRTVANFFLPYHIYEDQANCEFEVECSKLSIKCPINWNIK